jgi:hypothetical protein
MEWIELRRVRRVRLAGGGFKPPGATRPAETQSGPRLRLRRPAGRPGRPDPVAGLPVGACRPERRQERRSERAAERPARRPFEAG